MFIKVLFIIAKAWKQPKHPSNEMYKIGKSVKKVDRWLARVRNVRWRQGACSLSFFFLLTIAIVNGVIFPRELLMNRNIPASNSRS